MKPHRGWRSYLEGEMAGVGGQIPFLEVKLSQFDLFPCHSEKHVQIARRIALHPSIRKTSAMLKNVPFSERFFLGGEGYCPRI